MQLKTRFDLKRILKEGEKVAAVESIWRGFVARPDDRRLAELYEAARFGRCLEIWLGSPLAIWFVDEEKTNYKGVDFFLLPLSRPNVAVAYQLVELSGEYSPVKCAEDIGAWVAEKKFKKGDEKIELLVNIREVDAVVDIPVLQNMLARSPFLRTLVFSNVKTPQGRKAQLISYVQGNSDAYAFIGCDEGSLLYSTGTCPSFPKQFDARGEAL